MFSFLSGNRRKDKTAKKNLRIESLEERRVMTAVPYGAAPEDLGEYLLGSVAVTPVFFESTGELDPNTETWTEAHKTDVLNNINEGLDWWVDTLDSLDTVHELSFTVDETFVDTPAATRYEPISRRSNDYRLYVEEFLNTQGYNSGNLELDMRQFNHDQRLQHDTNWSFTMIVVPSLNDSDGFFAAGGSFRRAFAFAGGLFMVVPSTRPASTFAHELGHIFWARDEYAGGGSYFQRRGYYDTQNLNAHDNPTPGFVQEPSIMASQTLLASAYASNTSPASTLAQLGWQDSDLDGIFDVLDVPHQLDGTGYWDTASGTYRFKGTAKVQTLPNHNPSGIGNDITINRIREIQYRFDGTGAWQTDSAPNAYETILDLNIVPPPGATTIEIRAVDTETTVASNVFEGRLSRADQTESQGINGFVWIDQNGNNLRDVGEYGQEFWTVELVDGSGNLLETEIVVEPDNYSDGQLEDGFIEGLTLTTHGSNGDGRVGVFVDSINSTGNKNFRGFSTTSRSYVSDWNSATRQLRGNLTSAGTRIQIDAVGSFNNSRGRLEAYNAADELVGRYTTEPLMFGETETMVIERPQADIAYFIAGGHSQTNVKLDNLRIGTAASVFTDIQGGYQFPALPAGSYNVRVTPNSGFVAHQPVGGQQDGVNVAIAEATTDVDFGFRASTSAWQNPNNRYDVNADVSVTALDALLIINDLNATGSRDLSGESSSPPPYLDVSGDNFVTALDVLQVINFLNAGGSGEGEALLAMQGSDQDSQLRTPHETDNPSSPMWSFPNSGNNRQSPWAAADDEEDVLLDLLAGDLAGL